MQQNWNQMMGQLANAVGQLMILGMTGKMMSGMIGMTKSSLLFPQVEIDWEAFSEANRAVDFLREAHLGVFRAIIKVEQKKVEQAEDILERTLPLSKRMAEALPPFPGKEKYVRAMTSCLEEAKRYVEAGLPEELADLLGDV